MNNHIKAIEVLQTKIAVILFSDMISKEDTKLLVDAYKLSIAALENDRQEKSGG